MLKRTPSIRRRLLKASEAEQLSLEDTLQTLEGVEGTLITITPIDYDPILVGSIYIPPINNYFRKPGAALDTIFNLNNKTILVGDFNAKHTRGVATVATPETTSMGEHLTSLDTEDGSLWGTAKKRSEGRPPRSQPPMALAGTALSDTHKTELIAQSLESQFH
ncbi:hypothetical protein TNCV_2937131 [Trichonephila clavipes]|nr:hypothetical protein TNCV_2937131 [Trichonephila clavipes]